MRTLNIKPNYSELARLYKCDRRTVKKYDTDFIEINPRFQGSTVQLDKILKNHNLPSIFEYNYNAFNNSPLKVPNLF